MAESKETILKKLEQIRILLKELEGFLAVSIDDFKKDVKTVRAAERNFLLVVEQASEINAELIITKSGKTPDSYRQAFSELSKLNLFDQAVLNELINSAKLRNILVHEYDFQEDEEKFYASAKLIIPAYRKYIEAILRYRAS